MKYPKIDSYWKRDDKGVIIRDFDDLANPAFANIKRWAVTEKIDGTNVRIMKTYWNDDIVDFHDITIGGRNHEENSPKFNMPKLLMKYLKETFTFEKMQKIFGDANVTLFGEGYGAGIQKGGGKYREDQSFILFDVVIHKETGHDWWQERDRVDEMAALLGVTSVPIHHDLLTFDQIETMVKDQPLSKISYEANAVEGFVCRTEPMLFNRNGKPLMFKLKVKDYQALAKKEKLDE